MLSFPLAQRSSKETGRRKVVRACLKCRNMKIKCDGLQPICTPCRQRKEELECDYNGTSRTMVQVLERDVRRMEAKLRELETTGTVQLSNLFLDTGTDRGNTLIQKLLIEFDPASQEPSPELKIFLIDSFLPMGHDFAFFLDPMRFRASALATSSEVRPPKGLISICCAMGLRLCGVGHSTPHEEAQVSAYLTKAIKDVTCTNTLTHTPSTPPSAIDNVQALCLLSTFLFCAGRTLEGQYHLASAISLCLAAGFNKYQPLQSPTDATLRSHAFWTSFTLCNCWDTVVQGPRSMIAVFGDGHFEQEVDIPWPYSHQELPGRKTIQAFLDGDIDDGGISHMALYAKASILYKRSRKREYQTATELVRVEAFKAMLPPISSAEIGTCDDVGMQLVTHMLIHVSIIELCSACSTLGIHAPIHSVIDNTQRCLKSASACVELLQNPIVKTYITRTIRVNPMLGFLFECVSDVLVETVKQKRASQGSDAFLFEMQLRDVLDFLEIFGDRKRSFTIRASWIRVKEKCQDLGL